MSNINARLLMAAVAGLAFPVLPAIEDRRYAVWPPKQEPDDRGRRAEKDAIALAKAEAKRQRKAAKRLGQKVGADDTATERPNALAQRTGAEGDRSGAATS